MKTVLCWMEDRALQVGTLLAPARQQAEWLRAWEAELWYTRSRGRHDLAAGIVRDAVWLRVDSWREVLAGTPALCLVILSALAGTAVLPVLWLCRGHLTNLVLHLLPRFAVASGLTLMVSYATAFTTLADAGYGRRWLRASSFHAAKVLLLLLVAALVSTDLCLPLEIGSCFAAMPLELLLFVTTALLGLRWSFLDGQTRCKCCLRSLAPPRRIGPPSWNFLAYNGTELACRRGHGLLTIPELATSWCTSSVWVERTEPLPIQI